MPAAPLPPCMHTAGRITHKATLAGSHHASHDANSLLCLSGMPAAPSGPLHAACVLPLTFTVKLQHAMHFCINQGTITTEFA